MFGIIMQKGEDDAIVPNLLFISGHLLAPFRLLQHLMMQSAYDVAHRRGR